ncbi:hypothetical protein [Burkholderia ambifaria]|uniref:hypothetical protein n=1 Tax=Burkholderia ambifaria TaxID=152480 RepID=UPI00158B5745|nr:hypothetical protein [Burkholderia ambifaria]
MHDVLASMDIQQVLGYARHRRHAGRDGSLSIPCSCRRFACVGASCMFPTLHQALETAGVTPAQQVPRAV